MPSSSLENYGELPFSPVTAERATFLLRELDWGNHFIGSSMNPAMGNSDVYCYSLNGALKFLTQGSSRLGNLKGSTRTGMSWVEPLTFISWIRDKVGDAELADAIETALKEASDKAAASEATAKDENVDTAPKPLDPFASFGINELAPNIPFLQQISVISQCVGLRFMQLQEAVNAEESESTDKSAGESESEDQNKDEISTDDGK